MNEKIKGFEMFHHAEKGGPGFRFNRPGMEPHERHCLKNEIKLFTNKNEMVTYVNQLQGIENVEIYKIEDDLYKVLVSRKKEHHGCHHHDHEAE